MLPTRTVIVGAYGNFSPGTVYGNTLAVIPENTVILFNRSRGGLDESTWGWELGEVARRRALNDPVYTCVLFFIAVSVKSVMWRYSSL